jgi:hypothetical protein
MSTTTEKSRRPRRWGSRKQAMAEANVGPTKLNELMMGGRIVAKRLDGKVVIDLDSIQELYASLPTVREHADA